MKKIIKYILVIVLMLGMVITITGCGKKNKNQSNTDDKAYLQPLTNYFEGIKNKELSRVLKAFPDFMQMSEKITDTEIDDLYKQYESMYGANIKIDYSLGDAVTLGEDEIKELEDNLTAIYPDQENLDITAAYSVPVTVTITGDGITSNSNEENTAAENNADNTAETNTDDSTDNNNTEQEDMYVIQYNGNWYIM